MANIAKIVKWDIANGKGIRTSIFFSGCTHYCKNCFNQELWDFNVGKPFIREVYENEIKSTMNEHISGISILGGEPLNPKNIDGVYHLCNWFKQDFPDKDIWIWSGYEIGELMGLLPYQNKYQEHDLLYVLPLIDVLIDGKFIEEEKDLTLAWRGSKNQRVIDVQKTLKKGDIVLYEE